MNAAALGCVVCVGMLLAAEVADAPRLRALSKTAAAALMVATAVLGGALATGFGRRIALGLTLSAGGDVALLGRGSAAFMAGLSLFALAHLAYVAAAVDLGVTWPTALSLAGVLTIVAHRVWHWLGPWVPSGLRLPVLGYIAVITAMVALAVAAAIHGVAAPRFAVGAVLFFLSDLSVARDRFVAPSVRNKLWGLPAYFGGQLLIATSVI